MRKVLTLCVCMLLCSTAMFAQAAAGLSAISGTVRDVSSASVPGATVVVSNDAKGIRRTVTTTEAGVFAVPALVPSSGYSIKVTKEGFTDYEVRDFELTVGQTMDFRVSLQVGAATTKVDVTAEAPLVEDTKTGVASLVGNDQINNLPINGRRVDSYVLMTPAVTNDGEFGLISFRGIAMGNAFLTDGNDTTNSFYNENAGRTRIGSQISQDAVQEFQVLSNGFSAEFGRAMGGVVNTVSKSGGNDVHGTAYWFFRNRTLEAADRYSGGTKLPEWRHTVGGTLGGPIKKDKLFYFLNFDYTDRSFPALNRIINNSLTDGAGNTIPASNCTVGGASGATQAQCTAAINFIQRQMNVSVPRNYNQELGFGKIDWRPTERNSLSFDLNYMRWVSPHGIQTQAVLTNGNAIANNGNSTVQDKYGKALWTAVVTPNSVNEFRFGWFKDRLSDPAASDLWPAETGGLYLTVAGTTVGAAQAYPRTYPSENRYQLADNYSWVRGAHALKFGLDFSTTEDWMNQLFNGLGAYSYSNLTNFARDFTGNTTLLKNYSTFTQQFGNPIQDIRTTDINLFVQDTWKVTRKFTVGYGLRYEKSWLPQPTITNPDWPQTGHIREQSKNFAPRISLSYSLDDRTVLRAGYGMFYARMHGNMLDTLFLGNGKYQTGISLNPSQTGSPVFPTLVPSASGLPSGSVTLEFADPQSFRAPYAQQGTVALEHQFTRDIAMTVSYIWSRGIGLFTQRDLNLGNPVGPYTYTIQDAAGNNVSTYTTPVFVIGNRVDPRYAKILQVENGGQSWYNGLAVQVEKRFAHGFMAQMNYTWSHAIDDANQQGASWNISSTFNNATFNGNYPLDKGSSTLDQRHRFVLNWIWRPTFTKSTSTFARYFVNGWELSAITTLASAHPMTATMNSASTSANGVFQGVTLSNSTINGSGGWTRVPFLPVGTLDVDQIYNVDARLTRVLPFSERVKLNLAFEAFNLCNTIHNTGIQTSAYSVNAGGILKPVLTNGVSLLGTGNASQGFPDGTNARRMQVAVRLVF
ncbi:MAG TPA: carboxypeptidase regulatory-like domain-containing protein [Verrucomicrobiae bacterium]|nr:carboxypeptidase regulatory-like domain-containing protein [Verrucomicrobiae bacterium]